MKNASPIKRPILFAGLSLLWGSGLFWLILPNFTILERQTLSELKTTTMQIHGAAALLALVLIGAFAEHIRRGLRGTLRNDTHRWSGLLICCATVLLTVTAWMLYYVGDEELRGWASIGHYLIGLPLPVILFRHLKSTHSPGTT